MLIMMIVMIMMVIMMSMMIMIIIAFHHPHTDHHKEQKHYRTRLTLKEGCFNKFTKSRNFIATHIHRAAASRNGK